PDWSSLVAAAGLDLSAYRSVQPEWAPPEWADNRAAWLRSTEGSNPSERIEAASYRGRPVYFDVIYPWTRAERDAAVVAPTWHQKISAAALLIVFLVLLVSG